MSVPSASSGPTLLSAQPCSDSVDPQRWSRHTPYSDPGRHAERLASVPADLAELSAVARNLIIHYRASGLELPAETRQDINARWLSAILDLDHDRHGAELDIEREPQQRVQGCCRDHSLFAAAVLRSHRIPARIRYGFAGYFVSNYNVDHVVVETWLPEQSRWLRFDPEVESGTERLPEPRDIPAGAGAPFRTAAEVWTDYRAGRIDPDRYGVGPDLDVGGPWFIQGAVVIDAAFRAGHELLLWDGWDAFSPPGEVTDAAARLADELAELIIAADAGDVDAERRLVQRATSDPEVAPPTVVQTISPWGDPPTNTDLSAGPGGIS